jgi:hypothetical protein
MAPTERIVLSEIAHAKPRDERPVAVGITSEPMRLFAWDLSAGLLWERPVQAKSAPIVVADAIVLREASGIVVRDLGSGEVRTVVDEEGELIGADGQGRSVVVAIGYGEATPRAAVAYIEGDRVRWKQVLKLPVGVPALVGNYVLVPWATQRLSVLSTKNGGELARWDFFHSVVGYAFVDRGRVYVGQHGFMRVDEDLLARSRDAAGAYAPVKRSLPGQPPLLRDGYLPMPEPENAYHRLQLHWRVNATADTMSSENDLLMLRFYRMLFALDAREDKLRWVRTFDHDLIAAAIQPGGLFVADTAGTLQFVDAAGTTRMRRDLGRSLQVLAIRPGAWVPVNRASTATATPGAAAPAAPTAGATAPDAPQAAEADAAALPLREQLFAAAALDDDRLGAARAYAAEQMAMTSDASVTAHLIELCGNRKSPPPVQLAACSALAKCTTGTEEVARALHRRASFLEGTVAPAVGALAQAAAALHSKAAGPLLVAHVEDPNTEARELVPLLESLERLEHRQAAGAIERFVRLHHAEPEGSELAPALVAAVHALGAFRARSAQKTLEDLAEDGMTTNALRDKAREALVAIAAPPAGAAPKTGQPSANDAEPDDDDEIVDPRPYALSAEMIRSGLASVNRQLSQCLAADSSRPRVARVSMVVQGEGRVEGVFVIPTTSQACMEPLVREAKFPATRAGRQRITHVVHGANATKEAPKPAAAKRAAPKVATPKGTAIAPPKP